MGTTYVLPKLLYVSLYMLYGSAIGYIAIFYDEELNMTSQEIGLLLATPYFVQIISSPLWTMIADKHPHFQGRLMSLLTFLGGSSVLALLFLADLVKTLAGPIVFWLAMCLALAFSFFGSPLVALVDSSVLKILGDQKVLYGNQRLWGSISNGVCLFAVGIMVSSVGIRSSFYLFAAGMALLILFCSMTKFDDYDALLEEQQTLLSKSEARGNYAYSPLQEQRTSSDILDDDRQSRRSSIVTTHTTSAPPFFQQQPVDQSSIWRRDSIASHANTLLLDEDDNRRYHQLLQTITTTTTYAAMGAQQEASQIMSNLDQDEYPSVGLVLSHIPTVETSLAAFALVGQQDNLPLEKSTLKSLRVQTFMMMVLLFGLGYSMISQFLFLIYRNDIGMNPSLMGLTGPLAGVAEVMTFWLSKKLFDRFSVTTLTTMAHLFFVIRNMIFMMLKSNDTLSITLALGLQIVNGFCYAMMWSTAVAEVDTFFPEDQRGLAQGILGVLFSGLGYGLGSVLSGFVYDQYGYRYLLGVSASITLFGLAVFYIGKWQPRGNP
ncbi:major facilitator superfamily domain-containing protein [Halteromyces radiatus]|uniref:major facilitator superfamily domain-containing protein n=1 Tax=Halteromyces radiatus TaxID=101107 RepID=UPI00221E4B34|nr:major facilitator superfamily domain-containing protein [Halteromyces radiatus]KAI8086099.1 major facilitator superfamily domain-containing protein [Halteromyces radiatus]